MKAQPKGDLEMGEQPFDKTWWDSLDPDYRAELEQAIAEANSGVEGIPHEQVMAELIAMLDELDTKRRP